MDGKGHGNQVRITLIPQSLRSILFPRCGAARPSTMFLSAIPETPTDNLPQLTVTLVSDDMALAMTERDAVISPK